MAEIIEVLSRSKIRRLTGLDRRQVKELGLLLIEKAIKTEPQEKTDICRDPDDNKFLDCALAAKADYLVSGDNDLLDIRQYKRIKIINLKKFVEVISEISWAI